MPSKHDTIQLSLAVISLVVLRVSEAENNQRAYKSVAKVDHQADFL
jgi:hypothetical protein